MEGLYYIFYRPLNLDDINCVIAVYNNEMQYGQTTIKYFI